MNGYLLVDKPAGVSSFGVVARVRRILSETAGKKVKVGHTGTLDPLATGLLILVVGSYCKNAQEFSKMNKTYEVELTLGSTSQTGDREGPIIKVNNVKPTIHQINEAMASFIGEINQTPHAHSAVKVGGQRAYKLARAGKTPKLEPRKVTIYDIRNLKYRYPKVWFTADVSTGTYIRSLAEDVGKKLGVGAYLSSLIRTRVGKYKLEEAEGIDPDGIEFDLLKFIRQ